MTENVLTIRSSSLTGYPDCGRRGAANMFREMIEAAGFTLRDRVNGIGAGVGTAVHAAAGLMLKHKAEQGELGSEADAVEIGIESLRTTCAEGVAFDATTTSLNGGERQVAKMAKVFRATVARNITPMLVERRLEAEVMPGLLLSGQSDLIAQEYGGLVDDLKTGVRERAHAPQLGSYSLLGRSHGYTISRASSTFLPRVGVDKPQLEPVRRFYDVAHAESAATNILRAIEADLRTFQNGDPKRHLLPGDPWSFLANPSSVLCGPKYCSAHGTDFCREHLDHNHSQETV